MKPLFIHALKIFFIFLSLWLIMDYLIYSELRNDLESLFYKGLQNAFFWTALFTFIKWRELKKKLKK
ncbi:MAG: hypothetical protein P8I93_03150 [Crocinitomicaceae bacterium]|nr:hypothetical protein [Crocinitomicaceae bacterium]